MKKSLLILLLFNFHLVFAQMLPVTLEYFNSNGTWPVGQFDAGQLEVSGGVYKFWHKTEGSSWSVYTKTNYASYENYRVISKIRQVQGGTNQYFGLYMITEDKPGHYFYITSDGDWAIYYADNLIANGTSENINAQGNFNLFEILKVDGLTTFIVNNNTVFNTSEYDFTTDQIGWSVEGKNEIHIDYLKVYHEPKPFEIVEEFNENTQGWYTGESNNCISSLTKEGYVLQRLDNKGGNTFYKLYSLNWQDFYRVETRFQINESGDNDGFGFWMKDDDDVIYYYYITSKGYYVIRKIDGSDDRVIRNTTCPVSYATNKPIVLAFERTKNHLNFYLNGQLFETILHERFLGNNLGFVIYDKMTVTVSYLKIKQEPRPVNFVEHYENGYQKVSVGDNINTIYSEFSPIVSPDGTALFFVRDSFPEIIQKWGKANQDIYVSKLDENGIWGKPENMGYPLNNSGSNFMISITPDMNKLVVGNSYFPDGSRAGDGLSVASRDENGQWTVPVKQEIENYKNDNNFVDFALSPDGKVLVAAIETEESLGDLDLYVCFLKADNSWTEPKHMGDVINTWGIDFAPFIAADGKTMYFSSNGHPGLGYADIFMTRRLDDSWLNWEEPKNLGPEINTSSSDANFKIPASGEIAYLNSTDNSKGENDIFKIELPVDARPEVVVLIKGKVLNSKTNEPLGANIQYKLLKNDIEVGIAASNPQNGAYQIALSRGEEYAFMAQKEGFYSISDNIDLTKLEEYTVIERNLYLAPIEKGEIIRLNNIFFIFDSAELLEESKGELNQLLGILKEHPEMKIEIGGHTDNKGSDEYNLNLSERRAIAIMNYLSDHGISKENLSAKGYGETKPVSTNETDEGRQQNRRVEFKVL